MKKILHFLTAIAVQCAIASIAISGEIQNDSQNGVVSADAIELARGRVDSLKNTLKPIIEDPEKYGLKRDQFTSQLEMDNTRKKTIAILNNKGRHVIPIDISSDYEIETKKLVLAFSVKKDYSKDGYVIKSYREKDVYSTGYIGSNAYGATVQILKQRGVEYGVFFSDQQNPNLGKEVKKFMGALYEIKMKIDMEPDAARKLIGSGKKNRIESKFEALIVGEVVDPILHEDITYSSPTIDAPYDVNIKESNLTMKIEKIIVVNKSNRKPILEVQY